MKVNINYLKNKLLATSVCVMLIAGKSLAQTGIVVTYYDGSEQGYTVATTGKMYFDNSNLQIKTDNIATIVSIPVSIVRKITFSSSVVPLQLVSFTLRNNADQVLLSWETTNEVDLSYFLIEKSTDGTNYAGIGKVTASGLAGSYSYIDADPQSGITYYRLKQVDAGGSYKYSKVLAVNRSVSDNILLLPNPATSYFSIMSTISGKLDVKIFSVAGQLVASGNYSSGEQVNISKLKAGLYIAIINNRPYKLIKH